MQLLVDGKAAKVPQPAEGATYEPIMKKDLARVLSRLLTSLVSKCQCLK